MDKSVVNPEIFREYDIRGVYNGDFNDRFAYELGFAFVGYLQKHAGGSASPKLTVGHDARLSSPALARALAEGMRDAGARVVTLGLITTPISYFSMFAVDGVEGGFMVTGSHNPPEYNGFKVSVGKTTIFGDQIQELRRAMDNAKPASSVAKGTIESYDIFPSYLERYQREFGDLSGVPVVIDCGNGAAGCIARRLLEAVRIQATILFEEPDGRFPNHHPDPTVEKNLVDLKRAVAEKGARIGVGFDGDADRVGIVDDRGRFLQGDELMTIVSRAILLEKPGSKIVGDVKCSDRLYDDIRKHGGQPIMWKTGHSLIKSKIKEEKAPFGGELSGHVFFADRNYGFDDALYAGLRVIEILKKTGKSLSQLLEGFPSAFNTPEIRIDTTEEKKRAIVDKLKSVYARDTAEYKVNMIDGVRISFADGWALARVSNTQPVLVMRFESTSQAGLDAIQARIEGVVKPML